MSEQNLYAVIMAGGKGERFWPLGRQMRPKQLLPLVSEQSMIEDTVQRLFPLILPERILVITNAAFVNQLRKLLPIPPENVIGEPVGRDTAPCVALATALIRRRDANATMILLPADHVIRPVTAFHKVLKTAVEQAQTGNLVTIGIPPAFPSTGYGYIHAGEPVAEGVHKVIEFHEKPDRATAERFLKEGNYQWNSGMFIWRADAIETAFEKYCPELAQKIKHWKWTPDYETTFADCRKISIDYAIMEKADNVLVTDANFEWNDIGSWSALRVLGGVDDQGNVVRGRAVTLDARDNVLVTDAGMLLGVIGLSEIAVIQSGNGILVCRLADEQRVKELVGQLPTEWR